MKRGLGRLLATSVLLIATVSALCGCGLLDQSLSPRTYSVNESADSVLNDAVLLNIIRAGNSEPLNFVAIAKYTAGDQLSATGAAGPLVYAALSTNPTRSIGPASASGQVSNSFDLNLLETKEFYQGLLQNLDPIALELWFRQGLPRALVFHVLLDSIRVSTSDGVYDYKNDPTDDNWTDALTRVPEPTSEKCLPKFTGRGDQTNYDVDSAVWHGIHGEDCHFHKFQYLVFLAVKYGLRLETIALPTTKKSTDARTLKTPSALGTPSAVKGTNPNTSLVGSTDGTSAETAPKTKTQICYDAAVLRKVGVPTRTRELFSICGRNKPNISNEIRLGGIGTMKDTEFVMRSTFGIFQYLGAVFANDSTNDLSIGSPKYDVHSRVDDRLLKVAQSVGPDCFAKAWYRGVSYCVPNEGATNTKLVFTMLRAILATNTSAALLNSTPTIRVTP